MIKLIACDMDGTLLNSNGEIVKDNVVAIEYARSKGVHFVVCTGRIYDDVWNVTRKANLSVPAICMNGAEIRDQKGQIILQRKIDNQLASKTFDILTGYNFYTEIYTDIGVISPNKERGKEVMLETEKKLTPQFPIHEIKARVEKDFKSKKVSEISNPENIFNQNEISILKIISFSPDQEALKEVSKKLTGDERLSITSSSPYNIEITDRNAKKGISLRYYAEKLNQKLEEACAIGDNLNDLSMLEIVGYSVAMENADINIKKVVHHTTLSNDNLGVAEVIYKLTKETK